MSFLKTSNDRRRLNNHTQLVHIAQRSLNRSRQSFGRKSLSGIQARHFRNAREKHPPTTNRNLPNFSTTLSVLSISLSYCLLEVYNRRCSNSTLTDAPTKTERLNKKRYTALCQQPEKVPSVSKFISQSRATTT